MIFDQGRISGIAGAPFRIITSRDPDQLPARLKLARSALAILETPLQTRPYLVGETCTIADIAAFAYTHVADDAGLRLSDHPAASRSIDDS